jgi:hypothetical protein
MLERMSGSTLAPGESCKWEFPIMTKITVDIAIREKLHNLDTFLELCDDSGKTLGFFHPIGVSGARESRTGRSP